MFNKTRRNIVFAVVGSLLVLMAVTLTTIYLSNRLALQRENEEMLRTYVEQYSLEAAPDDFLRDRPGMDLENRPGMPEELPGQRNGRMKKNEPQFQLSTFYSAAYSADGEVLAVHNGNIALYSEEQLLTITSAILNSGKTSGKTGNMTYLVEAREGYTLVAMIDGTINLRNQSVLIRQMLIIGCAALAVLFVVSVFLARRIVKPLEENDERQKRFVSDAGHELKTPIAVISANSELLRRQIGESEWLDTIDYENERMSELVKELLVLSRAQSRDIPKETVDFSGIVSGEVLPFESLAFERGVRIEAEIEPDVSVTGNPGQLKQLISILLDNALEHGTGKEIRLSVKKEKNAAVLAVSNAANAIGEEQLAHLFDRFYRTSEDRGGEDAHYGLGLSIAKAITDAHGGKIRAGYGEGTITFTVVLPIR